MKSSQTHIGDKIQEKNKFQFHPVKFVFNFLKQIHTLLQIPGSVTDSENKLFFMNCTTMNNHTQTTNISTYPEVCL